MKKAIRILGIVAAVLLGLAAFLYFGGLIGQLLESYTAWEKAGGMAGQAQIQLPSPGLSDCMRAAFTHSGLKGMGVLLVAGAALALYFKFSDRFGGSG